MANLSYVEVLYGVVDPQDIEALVGLVDGHKNWGQFSTKMPSHIVVSLIDEIKRLREQVGGYKTLPDMD